MTIEKRLRNSRTQWQRHINPKLLQTRTNKWRRWKTNIPSPQTITNQWRIWTAQRLQICLQKPTHFTTSSKL